MQKVRIALVAALSAVALGVSATTANAAVAGTVINVSPSKTHWIMVSDTYPALKTWTVYPGYFKSNVKSFISGWDCRSKWGYVYKNGTWYPMTTSNSLALNCG